LAAIKPIINNAARKFLIVLIDLPSKFLNTYARPPGMFQRVGILEHLGNSGAHIWENFCSGQYYAHNLLNKDRAASRSAADGFRQQLVAA